MPGLPSPLSVEQIRTTILRATKPFIQKTTIFRLIQRIALVPHPITIEHVAKASPLAQKVLSLTLTQSLHGLISWSLQPHEPLRLGRGGSEAPRERSRVQEEEPKNDTHSHEEEPQNAQRWLEQSQPFEPLQGLREHWRRFEVSELRGLVLMRHRRLEKWKKDRILGCGFRLSQLHSR